MADEPAIDELLAVVLDRHGGTFAEEVGIELRHASEPLFRLLCMASLMSAPVGASIAVDATRAFAEYRWTTARRLQASTWTTRVDVLNDVGYGRHAERTATQLAEMTERVLDLYGGDLRKLRSEAKRVPDAERRRLLELHGVGPVGVEIFFREVQTVWPEIWPFADHHALRAARRLRLGDDAVSLSALVPPEDFPRLVAALVRTDLAGDHREILAAATASRR